MSAGLNDCRSRVFVPVHSQKNHAFIVFPRYRTRNRSDLIKFCESATARADMPEVARLLRGSVKLDLVLQLLQRHRAGGHRTLVFSQSKKMLNVIAAVLRAHGFRHRYGLFRSSIACKIFCVHFVHIFPHVNFYRFILIPYLPHCVGVFRLIALL